MEPAWRRATGKASDSPPPPPVIIPVFCFLLVICFGFWPAVCVSASPPLFSVVWVGQVFLRVVFWRSSELGVCGASIGRYFWLFGARKGTFN